MRPEERRSPSPKPLRASGNGPWGHGGVAGSGGRAASRTPIGAPQFPVRTALWVRTESRDQQKRLLGLFIYSTTRVTARRAPVGWAAYTSCLGREIPEKAKSVTGGPLGCGRTERRAGRRCESQLPPAGVDAPTCSRALHAPSCRRPWSRPAAQDSASAHRLGGAANPGDRWPP